MKENEEEVKQFTIFRIKEEQYCINSKCVDTMLQLPNDEVQDTGKASSTGFFSHRDQVVELFSLRKALDLPTSNQEYEEFVKMINARKEDHIRWVKELERCSMMGERFTLATDPHQCAFGKWYDHFESDNQAVSYQLSRIEEPHKKIHEAATEVFNCSQHCADCKREECLKTILTRVKEESMPIILKLLDETKTIFRSNVYRDMVLILNGKRHLGLVVDEVLSVEALLRADVRDSFRVLYDNPLVSDVKQREHSPDLILEINIQELLQYLDGFSNKRHVKEPDRKE